MRIEPADERLFADRVTWRYERPYDFYDEDEQPVKNPERYFAARDDDGNLLGFYYFEQKGDVLEYGLGLRPDRTGSGLGEEFVRAGLEFGRALYEPRQIILNVAAFNERAIKIYERVGFHETGRHMRSFERFGEVEFVEMAERRE